MLADLYHRLRAIFRRGAVEQELDDELAFHLERQIDKHVAAGKSRAEAERLARLDLGGVDATKEDARDARGVAVVDGIVRDVRYGVRVLLRAKAFTLVAVITLALGIGANTALFSVVNGVLLHPRSYPHPEELVRLHASKRVFPRGSISYPNFRDWQKMNHTFAAMAVSRGTSYTLVGLGAAEKIPAQLVSAEFFSLLGIQPVIGRDFARGEDEVGAAPVVVLGAGFWQRKLGGSRDVLGKTLDLDGKPFTIIGVLPEHLDMPAQSFQRADVFVPIGQWTNNLLGSRLAGLGIHGIGRLKPGVSVEQARADMATVTGALAEAYPDANKGTGATIIPLEEAIVGNVRPYLLVLLGAVGFVLLIACVNVANLLLARSNARARELAIRLALGASRGRILCQLLTESVILSLAGGALGLLLAAWGTGAVVAALPDVLPRTDSIGVDPGVLLYTAAISIASGVLFGLAPAIKASGASLHDTLKQGGRGTVGGRHRTQTVLVVMETALALVLLVGAGLMVRTLAHLWSIDPGFRTDGVTSFGVSLSPSLGKARPDAIRTAAREVEGAIAGTPGIASMSLTWGALPLAGDDETLFWVDGRPKPANQADMTWAVKYVVSPGYLDTMKIPLLRGRFLTAADDEHAPRVVVVDDVLAAAQFPGEDPIGRRIHLHESEEAVPIVGVVGHVKQWGIDQDDGATVRAQLYESFAQLPDAPLPLVVGGIGVLVRTASGAPLPLDALRARVQSVGGENVVFDVQTMNEILADSLADRRFSMFVLGAFAALALLLASVGIFGVVSYVVSQRTNEIGIRMALGAGRGEVMRMILGQGARMALVGVVLGVVAALALTRFLGDMLYGVPATDPLTFVAVAAGLTIVSLLACYVPARRAMRVDPMLALRHE